MAEFFHNSVQITLNDKERFTARLGDSSFDAPSLSAIKDQLDKVHKFVRFKALEVPSYGNKAQTVVEIAVIGVEMRRGGKTALWITDSKHARRQETVIRDTPQNRKMLERWISMQRRHEDTYEKMREEEDAFNDKIPREPPPAGTHV